MSSEPLSTRIMDYMNKNPGSKMADLMRNFPGSNYHYVSKVATNFRKGLRKNKPKRRVQKKKSKSKGKKLKRLSLMKIDEHLLEEMLLEQINTEEWDLKLIREVSAFLNNKSAFKQEVIDSTPTLLKVDFKDVLDSADTYIVDIKRTENGT